MAMPEYTDGVLELLRIEEDNLQDFPVEKVRSTGMHIWYRELSVFDTTRAKLSADGIEVTMKISIPQYKQVNSKCICVIDGAQHEIYNVAHVTTKDGFKETELTLKTPALYLIQKHGLDKVINKEALSEDENMEAAAKLIYIILRSNGLKVDEDEALILTPMDPEVIRELFDEFGKKVDKYKKKEATKKNQPQTRKRKKKKSK